jgi:hypothetical protein
LPTNKSSKGITQSGKDMFVLSRADSFNSVKINVFMLMKRNFARNLNFNLFPLPELKIVAYN